MTGPWPRALLPTWLTAGLFRPRYRIRVKPTSHGPAVEVHRKILGMHWKVGESTFARVVDRHFDRLAAQIAQRWSVSTLLGGSLRPPAPAALARRPAPRPPRPSAPPPTPSRLAPAPAAEVSAPPRRQPSSATVHHPAWSARCDRMARNGEWADAPEVQAAAHLLDVTFRVFTRRSDGSFAAQFVANPHANGPQMDLVLDNHHYRWVDGGVAGRRFDADSEVLGRVVDVPGDGNCFFHSVVGSLAPAGMTAQGLRAAVVAVLRHHPHALVDGGEVTLADAFA